MPDVTHTAAPDATLRIVPPKPFRLSPEQRERLCNAFEAAVNSGHDELRSFLHAERPVHVPVRLGKVAA